MKDWIFTFGFGHVHPETGERLGNTFVRVSASTPEEARLRMVERFGLKWAFQYDDESAAGVDRFNLRELR